MAVAKGRFLQSTVCCKTRPSSSLSSEFPGLLRDNAITWRQTNGSGNDYTIRIIAADYMAIMQSGSSSAFGLFANIFTAARCYFSAAHHSRGTTSIDSEKDYMIG